MVAASVTVFFDNWCLHVVPTNSLWFSWKLTVAVVQHVFSNRFEVLPIDLYKTTKDTVEGKVISI